ncbi:MAG TPA: ankyrin repeat domain-containing protein, partial [Acidobacteriota bacterium]|nr:ankyrin repeat domain-containing protein [Acidobacteriota bacterium]
MALIHCPECRIEVSSKAPTCPKCAYPLSRLTTLPQAILKGDVELVEDVIKSGADVNERTKNENTPLFIAAATGDCRIIQSLLSAGASAQTRNDEGETPLDIARKKRRKQAIALLQEMLSEKANDRPRETQEEGIVRIIKKTPAGDKVIRDFQSTEKKVSAALSCTKCAQ